MVSRYWLYFAGSLVAGALAVGSGLVGVLEALSVLSGGAPGEEFVLLAMLGAAAEWILLVLAFGVLSVLLLVATVVSVLRQASLPRDDRLATAVERLEYRYPILRQFDASEKFEPTTEDRMEELKERYVAGELSESEFERRMSALLDDEDAPEFEGIGTDARDGTTIEIEDESR